MVSMARLEGRWWLVVAWGVASACTPNDVGFGRGEASGVGGTTGEATAGDPATTTTAATGDVATGDAGDSNPPTDGSGEGSTGTTGGPPIVPPTQEQLGRSDFTRCDQPLWCYQGSIDEPAGGAMRMQECFRAKMEPPFRLVQIDTVIRGMSNFLQDVRLEIYQHGAQGPGEFIAEQMVPRSDLVLGANTITLDPPVMLNDDRFCIGLRAPESGLYGSLGVSVDPIATSEDVSYLQILGNEECWLPAWTDVVEERLTPSGNWCIHGTIEK